MYRYAFSVVFIFALFLFWMEIRIIQCQKLRTRNQGSHEITSDENDYFSHRNNIKIKNTDDAESDISETMDGSDNGINKAIMESEDNKSKFTGDSEDGISIAKTSDETKENKVESIDYIKEHGGRTAVDSPCRYNIQIKSNIGKLSNELTYNNNNQIEYDIARATGQTSHQNNFKLKDIIGKNNERTPNYNSIHNEDDTYIVSNNRSPHNNERNIQMKNDKGKPFVQIEDDIDNTSEESSRHKNIRSDHGIGKTINSREFQVKKLHENLKIDNFQKNPPVTQFSFYDFTNDLQIQSDNDADKLHNHYIQTASVPNDDIMTMHSMELRAKDNENEADAKAKFKNRNVSSTKLNGIARLKHEPRKHKLHKHKKPHIRIYDEIFGTTKNLTTDNFFTEEKEFMSKTKDKKKQEGKNKLAQIKQLDENRDILRTEMTPAMIRSDTEDKELVTKNIVRKREYNIKQGWKRKHKKKDEENPIIKSHHKDKLAERSRFKSGKLQYGLQSNRKPINPEKSRFLNPYNLKGQLSALKKKLACNATIEQEVIGRTVEYNDIILWKIRERRESDEDEGIDDNERKRFKRKKVDKSFRLRKGKTQYADDKPEKKIVFIVHGLTVMGWPLLKCLSDIKRLETLIGFYIDNLDCFDIYLIPMANPDGVTRTLYRQTNWLGASKGMWNKNVSPQKACPGVNLDRNFDIGWNATVVKDMSSCSQQYPGPSPLSELETQAIRDVLKRYSHKMIGFFHVHAGSPDTSVFRGDAVLHPKGYTDVQMDDDKYVDLRGEIEEGMRNTSFNVLGVTVDTLYNWYGPVFGTSVDYASTIFGIPYSLDFSMQLYDDDTLVTKEDDREQNTALKEIWQIVFDVIFNHMYRSLERKD